MLFIFFDFNIDTETARIGLIPDFIGYILIVYGLNELINKSGFFKKTKPFAIVMAVYTGVLYAMDLFGVTSDITVISFILGLASTIMSLYISYNIVMGVKDMETVYSQQLNGDSLLLMWKLLAVFSIIIYALVLIPALGIIALIAGLVISVLFLISFNTARNLYYRQNRIC